MKRRAGGLFGVAAALALAGCVPMDALKPGVDAVVEVNSRLSPALDAVLERQRTAQRLDIVRAALTEAILGGRLDFENVAKTILPEPSPNAARPVPAGYKDRRVVQRVLLCEPRDAYAVARAHQSYTTLSVAGARETAAASSDKPGELVGSIFTDWSRRFPSAMAAAPDVRGPCVRDLDAYQAILFPRDAVARPETDPVTAITAAISLVEVLYEVFRPAIIGGLQEIDRARRAEALQAWLNNDTNARRLQAAIDDARLRIVRAQQRTNAEATARFVRSTRPYEAGSAQLGSSARVLSGVDCRRARAAYQPSAGNDTEVRRMPDFERCFAALLAVWAPVNEEMLTAAAEFDRVADTAINRAPDDFESRVAHLRAIATGSLDPTTPEGRAVLEGFYALGVRVAAWLEQVNDAASSEENRKKVREALDRLREAVGR